ncbi:hypothetical protein E2C01_033555 [Portunus trituberculatus]|uniref:Uncharacterized protein n=1 Tax=Portunus trituberculatus TaxID=210409 RepID=A0A5B7F0F4_PORTR|nr:hypothetical protein [Portunus trituberculatus]
MVSAAVPEACRGHWLGLVGACGGGGKNSRPAWRGVCGGCRGDERSAARLKGVEPSLGHGGRWILVVSTRGRGIPVWQNMYGLRYTRALYGVKYLIFSGAINALKLAHLAMKLHIQVQNEAWAFDIQLSQLFILLLVKSLFGVVTDNLKQKCFVFVQALVRRHIWNI